MQQYARNVEQAYELGSILKSEKESDSAKEQAQEKLDALSKSNLHMLDVSSDRTLDANLAIAKDADAKIGLEQIIIDTLEHYDLVGRRITGLTGVWVGEDKIAAQGVKISRWVTMHGFSLNINPDLLFYDGIIPCGIFHHGVTSVELLLGKKINMEEVKEIIIKNFNNYFYKR